MPRRAAAAASVKRLSRPAVTLARSRISALSESAAARPVGDEIVRRPPLLVKAEKARRETAGIRNGCAIAHMPPGSFATGGIALKIPGGKFS